MLIFLYLLNVLLLSRAVWIFADGPVRFPVMIVGATFQLLALLPLQINWTTVPLLVGGLLLNLLSFVLDGRLHEPGHRTFARIVILVCWLLLLALVCSNRFDLAFSFWALRVVDGLIAAFDGLGQVDSQCLQALLGCSAGVLLAVAESHVVIRFFFHALQVKPTMQIGDDSTAPSIDQVEYNRGRVIGALERILCYFLVLQGAYSALGFLIAAKGMTRFKQLDNREFAEYFLIGTLLSVLLAGMVALLVRSLLGFLH